MESEQQNSDGYLKNNPRKSRFPTYKHTDGHILNFENFMVEDVINIYRVMIQQSLNRQRNLNHPLLNQNQPLQLRPRPP